MKAVHVFCWEELRYLSRQSRGFWERSIEVPQQDCSKVWHEALRYLSEEGRRGWVRSPEVPLEGQQKGLGGKLWFTSARTAE